MNSKINCTCGWSWNKSDSSKKDMYICHECGRDNKMKNGGWLDSYQEGGEIPIAQKGTIIQKDLTDSQVKQVNDLTGMNFEPEFAQKYFMPEEESKLKDIQKQQQIANATLQHTNKITDITSESPGAFSNKRIWHDKRPEQYLNKEELIEGKQYTTIPYSQWSDYQKSPQYMKYKKIPPTNTVASMQQGGIIKDDRGQWGKHKGEPTRINQSDPESYIDMGPDPLTGIPLTQPLLGISDKGERKIMYPGEKHKFKKGTKYVDEFPIAKNGLRQEQKGLKNLDDLTNFTNYNKPNKKGWLDNY